MKQIEQVETIEPRQPLEPAAPSGAEADAMREQEALMAPPPLVPVKRSLKRRIIRRVWRLRMAIGIVLAAVIIAYTILSWQPRTPPSRYVVSVARAKFSTELQEIGSIQASIEIPVLSRFAGEIIWKLEEGTYVEAGDPVVRFDTKAVEEDIETREKDLLDKQEAVRKAKADIETSRRRYDNLIKWHELNVQLATMKRQRTYDMPDYDERLEAELNLKIATLDLQRMELETSGYAELAKQGFVAEAAYNKKLLELKTQQTNHSKAKLVHDLTLQGAVKITKYLADLSLADARRRLDIFKFNRGADLTALQANLELAQVELTVFEREMAQRREELEFGVARAPVRGRVAFRDVFKGSMKNKSPIQVGEQGRVGGELCTICDTSSLRINLLVNETDIKHVAPGQKATVHLSAFPDRVFEAVVSRIGVQAQDKNVALSGLALQRAGEAFVNVVPVRLDFLNLSDADRNEMRVGFTANVTLQTSMQNDTLVVPWQAVQYAPDGTTFCEIAGNGEVRTVRIGRSDTERVEILEGLRESDQLYAVATGREKGKGG